VSLALDAVGPANRPTRDELNAYLDALRGAGLAPSVTRTLRSGVRLALSAAGPDSLLVLHGAQAMEAGTAALKEALEGRAPAGWARKPQLRAEPISEEVRRSIES